MLSSDDLAKDDLEFMILPSAKITYIKVSFFVCMLCPKPFKINYVKMRKQVRTVASQRKSLKAKQRTKYICSRFHLKCTSDSTADGGSSIGK